MSDQNDNQLSNLTQALLAQALARVSELTLDLDALREKYRKLEAENTMLALKLSKLSLDYEVIEEKPLPQASQLGSVAETVMDRFPGLDAEGKSPAEITPLAHPIAGPSNAICASAQTDVSLPLTPDEKIALFRGLFFGPQKIFAVRWDSLSTGKSGYSPARNHNYQSHVYDPVRKKTVCADKCPNIPVSDEVVKHHLQGKHVIGTYPLMANDTCIFLAVDLDEADWEADARALLVAAQELKIFAYLERSRSGNGGHIWIFFDQPVPASQARRLGDVLITRANNKAHQLKLSSYDRMFPSQDTMPAKGYGNLIALPLQKEALRNGNSAFLDAEFRPYVDQWALLQSAQKVSRSILDRLVSDAARQNAIIPIVRPSEDENASSNLDPWALPPSGGKLDDTNLSAPLPAKIAITLGNLLYIDKSCLSPSHINRICRIAAFQNPKFYENQSLRISNYKTPRIISCADDFPGHVGLPRGCLDSLLKLIESSGVPYEIKDHRFTGNKIKASFFGKLRPDQNTAVKDLMLTDSGMLAATTAFGKTVVAANILAKRKVNTLILVHRAELLEQWRQRLGQFLELPEKSIGQIGAGKNKPTGYIDIATIQSLCIKGEVKDLVASYGHVIVDECHHVGASSFEQVMRQVKAKYVLGLTATPVRKDGHHPIVVMQCGPIRHRVQRKDFQSGIETHLVIPRLTEVASSPITEALSTQEVISTLVGNEKRNELIIKDVIKAVAERRTPLVVTERTEHLEILSEKLAKVIKNTFVFRGGLGKRQLTELRNRLASVPLDEPRVVLATGKYIGEGFDDARLDTLFLAMPISWRGTLEQYAGRLHRAFEGKKEVQIYDYVDFKIDKLYRMYGKRQAGYKRIGYQIQSVF